MGGGCGGGVCGVEVQLAGGGAVKEGGCVLQMTDGETNSLPCCHLLCVCMLIVWLWLCRGACVCQ